MADFINSADIDQTIIPETTFAQTPASGATRYELPVKVDSAPLSYKTQDIKSDTKRPKRAGNGKRQGQGTADGTWEFRLTDATYLTPLMESAMSGKFASKVLKAGDTDSTFTTIAKLASNLYEVTPGCIVNSMTIAGKKNDAVTCSFNVTGASRTNATTDNALTITAANGKTEYTGEDVASVTVNGVTLNYTDFEVTVSHPKTPRGVLGTKSVIGYGVQGAREVTATLQCYKGDFSLAALAATGAPTSMEIVVGKTGDGWKLAMTLADTDAPQDSIEEGSLFQSITLTARYDATPATDFTITRL